VVSRRRTPRRYAAAFSPEHALPADVRYIPYRHAVAQARGRRQLDPLVAIALAVIWTLVTTFELVGGTARVPVLLGLVVVSFLGFAAWNVVRLALMRRGDPSGAVWRYGLFLWPDALVVLPVSGPVVIVPIDAIESVHQAREPGPPTGPDGERTERGERLVTIRAVDERGAPVNVVVDDLGAMPAPHLVRVIESWRG
jgi:hypothetical protein